VEIASVCRVSLEQLSPDSDLPLLLTLRTPPPRPRPGGFRSGRRCWRSSGRSRTPERGRPTWYDVPSVASSPGRVDTRSVGSLDGDWLHLAPHVSAASSGSQPPRLRIDSHRTRSEVARGRPSPAFPHNNTSQQRNALCVWLHTLRCPRGRSSLTLSFGVLRAPPSCAYFTTAAVHKRRGAHPTAVPASARAFDV